VSGGRSSRPGPWSKPCGHQVRNRAHRLGRTASADPTLPHAARSEGHRHQSAGSFDAGSETQSAPRIVAPELRTSPAESKRSARGSPVSRVQNEGRDFPNTLSITSDSLSPMGTGTQPPHMSILSSPASPSQCRYGEARYPKRRLCRNTAWLRRPCRRHGVHHVSCRSAIASALPRVCRPHDYGLPHR
jgi:hypothetical protein